jgi:protein involved in polysaccharide export with SLBB domain
LTFIDMSRTLALILTTLVASVLTVDGQMSTFPAPPPLAPPSQSSSGEASSLPRTTLSTDSNSGGSSSSTISNGPVLPTTLSAATLTSMAALDDKMPLRAGDTVSFRVIEDRDDPVTRVVADTGEVDFPYIGRVKVEGKTCKAVATDVKKLLEVDYYKQATVILGLDIDVWEDKTKAKDMAWVVGEVKEEGPLELVKAQPTTVSQAILRAGGFADFADQRAIKVIHRDPNASGASNQPPDLSKVKDVQVIDIKAVLDGKSNLDPVLKSGDYIIVPKRFFNY